VWAGDMASPSLSEKQKQPMTDGLDAWRSALALASLCAAIAAGVP
jgi:hypothetical protein